MANYAYKDIAYRDDFCAVAERMKQQNPELEEGDFHYDGDGLVVVSELLDEKDAEIARLRAVVERLRGAHQDIVDDHAYCEKQGGSQFGDRAPAYAETSRKALEGSEGACPQSPQHSGLVDAGLIVIEPALGGGTIAWTHDSKLTETAVANGLGKYRILLQPLEGTE